ncbi:hypothetical protein FQA39_LY00748 [Lamprigera yunnana]|nr:hypothetical protein FQA39_LY00748 [Lamprigera yunnana]
MCRLELKYIILLFGVICVYADPQLDIPAHRDRNFDTNSYSTSSYDRNLYGTNQYDYDRTSYNGDHTYDTNFPYNRDTPNNNPPALNSDYDRRGNSPFHRDIRALLQSLDLQASQQCTNNVAAQWNFETNVNQATQLEALNAQQVYSQFQHELWNLLNKVGIERSPDPLTFRQLKFLSVVGPAALSPDQLDRYNRLVNEMLSVYNGASICAHNEPFRCGLKLQPDLKQIMAKSRNWDELQYTWTEWRRNTGRVYKESYEQMIQLSNAAARKNNFTDTSDYWQFPYESPSLHSELEEAWETVKPLYELLHAYVRRRLRDFYGPEKISRRAPLPAHILGNMWGQSWSNIFDITQPYPGRDFLDVGPEMIRQGYTPLDMFRLAEDFFVSMNFSALPLDFWSGSLLQEPQDRVVLCQPSAWDFCNREDFRIKMCTRINMKDLITAHHELAHVHYFIQYRNLPKVFRDGANPAFHEAIGEAIGLSIGTPRHLQALGLVQMSVEDSAVDINFLYNTALDKVAFLPFTYLMDKWRYDVFKGDIYKDQYNCHWWRLSETYTGVKPPVLRSEMDFDPGAKYHIPANIPYMRFFVSTLLQFQLYRALCRAAGQYDAFDVNQPLHKCDIYRSKEAGQLLKRIMDKGASMPWNEVLFQAIGESRLDGNAMREYFRPLEDWLRNENLRTQEFVGWLYDGDYCKQSIETAGLQVYGGFYNSAPKTIQSTALTLCASIATLLLLLS